MEKAIKRSNIVKLMRKIRDQLSMDLLNLNIEDQKKYIQKQLDDLKKKRTANQ